MIKEDKYIEEHNLDEIDKAIKFLDEQLVNDKDEVTGEPFINFRNYGAFKETFISFFKRKMLEKQGEQKASYTTIVKTGDGGINALVTRELPTDGCDDEQKPANSYCQENCKGFQEIGKCFAGGECKAKRDAEQKPAWSEEDEEYLQDAINYFNIDDALQHSEKEIINWLKSLKQRIGG